MAIQTLITIKNWFKTGLKPTQTQFWDTWDSFRHKDDKIPVVDVEGIDDLLFTKADKAVLKDHLINENKNTSLFEAKLAALEMQVVTQKNADWNATSGAAQILNKPSSLTSLKWYVESSAPPLNLSYSRKTNRKRYSHWIGC